MALDAVFFEECTVLLVDACFGRSAKSQRGEKG
jgi:hypothetical protein